MGSASDPHGSNQLVDGGGSLLLEVGARFGLPEHFRVLAHQAACTEHVALITKRAW